MCFSFPASTFVFAPQNRHKGVNNINDDSDMEDVEEDKVVCQSQWQD